MSAHNRVWEKMRQKNKRHHRKHLDLALLSVVLCLYSQQNLGFVRNAEKNCMHKIIMHKTDMKKKEKSVAAAFIGDLRSIAHICKC